VPHRPQHGTHLKTENFGNFQKTKSAPQGLCRGMKTANQSTQEILERLRRSKVKQAWLAGARGADLFRKVYAEKLVSDGPALKRGADQLDDASRLLLTKVSVKSSNVEAEATRFLGMHGYNCTRLQRARNSVQLAGGGDELLERLAEADVDGYLRHQRRVILLTAIEESKVELSWCCVFDLTPPKVGFLLCLCARFVLPFIVRVCVCACAFWGLGALFKCCEGSRRCAIRPCGRFVVSSRVP
jgi:hypothetical protein